MEIRHKIPLFFVTCGFVGYLPIAPGTWASALGVVLAYLFPFPSFTANLVFVVVLTIFSVLFINWLNPEKQDPGYIVIDELAGMYVTLVGHRPTILNLVAGFILFRIFDVIKPFPVNRAEELKKGYGIVADDIVAGVYANIILVIVGLLV